MQQSPQNQFNYTGAVKYSLIIFLVMSISLVGFQYFLQKNMDRIRIDELTAKENWITATESRLLGKEINGIIADLYYLTNTYETGGQAADEKSRIIERWREFAQEQKIYDQIRFIDSNGDEKIRINYSREKGAYVVESSELQNKKDRYYFTDTINLEEGQVYISKLDLNIENDAIEVPYKPMIRFGAPVYDQHHQLMGIVMLNYLAENLIDEFKNIGTDSSGRIYLLNSAGYWLSSTDPEEEWGFMFAEKKDRLFSRKYPSEWERINRNESSFITPNGLFTASAVILADKFLSSDRVILDESDWKVVTIIGGTDPEGYILSANWMDRVKRVITDNLFDFGLVLLISFSISLFIEIRKQSYLRIKYLSEYDAFTGVLNRGTGLKRLHRSITENKRQRDRISICMIDINGLKMVNDILGHDAGDELILTIVHEIAAGIRETDYIFRHGGDEFIVVCHDTDQESAECIWQRIAARFNQINQEGNRPYNVSASHGIINAGDYQYKTVEELIKMADQIMYEEKRKIKQQITVVRNT